MTALMQADLIGKGSFEFVDFEYIGEEFDQLEYLAGDVMPGIRSWKISEFRQSANVCPIGRSRLRRLLARRIMNMFLDVQHTTAGGSDNVIELLKIFDEEVVASFSEMFEAGVCHRLAAAGLFRRIDHLAAKLFKQLEGSDTDLWVELVDITGYK